MQDGSSMSQRVGRHKSRDSMGPGHELCHTNDSGLNSNSHGEPLKGFQLGRGRIGLEGLKNPNN